MGTTNVTSLLSPTISALTLKGALFLKRNLRIEEKEAGQYGKICNFSPLDSEQSAYSWETTVRSSSGANSSDRPGCSGSLPDFLHHHTRDDLGHSIHRENRERMSSRADPKVPTSMPDSLQELLSNRYAANSTDRSPNLTRRQSAAVSKRLTASLDGKRMDTEARSGLRFRAPASRTTTTPVATSRSRNWSRFRTPTARMFLSRSARRCLSNSASRSPTQPPSRFARMCTGRSLRG